jgi:hypothetical protein
VAARERLEERALLLDRAARRVDVDRALLHEAQRLVVDHRAGLVGQRRVAREHVHLRQERLQAGDRLRAAPPHLVRGHVLVVREDLHADRARELRDAPPDVADAHDAERLAVQLGVAAAACGPVAGACGLVDEHRALHADEHQHERVLRHGLRVRARRVHDRHAEPCGRGDVHDVEPRPMAADDLELGQRHHEALRAGGTRAKQDPIRVGSEFRERALVLLGGDDDARLLLEKRLPLGMDRAAHDDEGTGIRCHRTISLRRVRAWAALYVGYRVTSAPTGSIVVSTTADDFTRP